ncbi:MAG: glycoside hydrolase family 13 protein [Clostridia bacterium]|nr:glycoside hydrolase family 13 protein [Clostridia bacterium]
MKFIPFDSRDILYKSPFGAVSDGKPVTLRLLLHNDAHCSGAFVKIREDAGREQFILLTAGETFEDDYRWYSTELTLPEGLYWYSFCFDSPWGRQFVTRFKNGEGHVSRDGGEWQLTVYEGDYKTPDRFAGGIIYQIFPDRFYNSGTKKANVPDDRYIHQSFNETPEYRQLGEKCSLGNDYFGGDLEGVRQKLPYLKELGVSIIYLNPIFEAHSNHRYNTADYMKIDPMLGTEDDLKRLCKEAKKLGIAIVLDGVFSHTGDDSIYFNRYKRYGSVGAFESKESKYYNWYNFHNWPNRYSAWWGVPSLPETNENDKDFSEFITGKNGVLRKWLKCGASGWRLDVADELPDSFLDKIRKAVKSENKDAIIIGEVWEDATNKISYGVRRRYLRGKQLDSVMNYPFASALIKFLTGGSGDDLCDTVMSVCENYPRPALRLLMNHIGTHDTERILTALGGEPTGGRGRAWQSGKRMNENEMWQAKKLLYIAALLQYTLPGIPSLYYGDEAGMEGYGDPFCRGFYPWGKEDNYLVDFYKRLGQFRRSSDAFIDGDFIPVSSGAGHFAFIRRGKTEEVLVCANRWYEQQIISVGKGFEQAEIVFGYKPQNGLVKIDGLGFTVLRKKI